MSFSGTKRTRRTAFISISFVLCLSMLLNFTACFGGESGPAMGSTNPGHPRDSTPVVLEVSQPGNRTAGNRKVIMDYSNSSDGYFCVRSYLGSQKVKVLVDAPAIAGVQNTRYQYTIQNTSDYITIPFSQGNGTYTVGVYEHVTGDKYSPLFTQEVNVQINDERQVFLYPNQYVDFSAGDTSTQLSQEVVAGATSDLEAINGIYQWVTDNITYDEQEAVTVASGYLPDNEHTISAKTGICFDYAVLTVSMLREQRIPARLVIGYADRAYHAWIDVYDTEAGSISSYQFDGSGWVRMDPTFSAAGGKNLSAVIGEGTNYTPMLYY